MRMLYIKTSDFDEKTVGGSITHTIGMVNGFLSNGIDEDVLLRKPNPLIRANQIELQIKPQKKPFLLGDRRYHKAFFKAADKYMRETDKQYDFLYFRHRLMCKTGIRLSKKYKIPCVAEFNSFCHRSYRDTLVPAAIEKHGKFMAAPLNLTRGIVTSILKRFEKKILRESDIVVTVSEVLKKELIEFGVNQEKIMVLPNGVDPTFFINDSEKGGEIREKYHIPENKNVVGFAGTFGNWHGIDELTDAIVQLKEDNFEFLLMGDGMMRKRMEETLKNREDVHFLGKVPFEQMPAHLSACDILIISNSWNPNDNRPFFGSPTKLFEYMSMSKAIVASDLMQIGQILENGKTAVLFPTGNTRAMADAVRYLGENQELRTQLGEMARKVVSEKYTWERNASKVIERISAMGEK